jgi:glycerol uptake facilitator-like aquaporin
MNIAVIGAATSGISLPATAYAHAEAAYATGGQYLRRATRSLLSGLQEEAGRRREALAHRLENFVLELLAAIVLIAIFMIVTDPSTRTDC